MLKLLINFLLGALLATIFLPVLVGAELSPHVYARLQNSAAEKLHIMVAEVKTSGWLRQLFSGEVLVEVQAKVLRVDSSAAGLVPGAMIRISYRHQKMAADRLGPSEIPILSAGEVVPAFLEHVAGDVYAPAARGRSFRPVKGVEID